MDVEKAKKLYRISYIFTGIFSKILIGFQDLKLRQNSFKEAQKAINKKFSYDNSFDGKVISIIKIDSN